MRGNIFDLKAHDITGSQFAIDSHVEHGQIPQASVDLEFGSY